MQPLSASAKDLPWWRSGWALTAAIWILRWLVILPINWAHNRMGDDGATKLTFSGNLFLLFLLLVLVAPLLETLIECSLPYGILSHFMQPVPPLIFIIASSFCMTVLHLVSPMAMIDALITGAFIAWVYALAVRRGHDQAILHAMTFHAAINLVGWLTLFFAAQK
jgi:Type II CAAX prenyl endopeptidase Rce1-like